MPSVLTKLLRSALTGISTPCILSHDGKAPDNIFHWWQKNSDIIFLRIWMAFNALLAILRVLCSERWWLHLSSQFVTKCYLYFSRLAFVTPFKLKGLLLCKRIHILWPLPKIASRYFVKMLPTDYQQTLRKRTLGGPNLLHTFTHLSLFVHHHFL